jgi:hypothetical protein
LSEKARFVELNRDDAEHVFPGLVEQNLGQLLLGGPTGQKQVERLVE